MLRVLCEWVLARSAPSSPLVRACAMHLLCRDAGFLHDAELRVRLVLLLAAVRVRVLGQCVSACSTPASSRLRVCALHLLCRD